MLRKRMQHLLGALGLVVLLGAPIVVAQESPPVRVRGTIEQVDGLNLVVKSRDGAELKVVLADNALVVAIAKASLAHPRQLSVKCNGLCHVPDREIAHDLIAVAR